MQKKLQAIFEVIDAKLTKLPKNHSFSLPELYGEEKWQEIYIGDRVMTGNRFRREVLAGHYPNVRLLPDKDEKNRTQYEKR